MNETEKVPACAVPCAAGRKLVIDPGHGGSDPGAVNAQTGLHEADVVLRIVHALKAIFDTHPEFEVSLTRDRDETVSLRARTDLANELDVPFISIHCNAAPSAGASGVETWCFAETDHDGSESKGHRLARAIQKEVAALGMKDRGVKAIYDRNERRYIFRKLWVLRKTRRAAVILECGFISNAEDAARLGDDHIPACAASVTAGRGFKERVAVALFTGIRDALIAHQ